MNIPPTDAMRSACYHALSNGLRNDHDPYVLFIDDREGARPPTVKGLVSRGLAEVRPGATLPRLTEAGIDVAKEEWAKRTGGKPIPTPLFHRTSDDVAAKLLLGGAFDFGREGPWVYFSTVRAGGLAEDSWGTCVRVLLAVRPEWLHDELPDGEEHYRVPLAALRGVRPTYA